MTTWEDLNWWRCGEWDAIQEKLDALEANKIPYNPHRYNIFRAFEETPLDRVKVALLGQDPYPNPAHAMGLAFSVPKDTSRLLSPLPPTIREILKEYVRDLGYPMPTHGDLSPWTEEGVLLWNVIPTCTAWKSKSHDWEEWKILTQEVVNVLQTRGTVFCAIGSCARSFVSDIPSDNCRVLEVGHPSPLNTRKPFEGSRIFSTINHMLTEIGREPIDWML